MLKMVNLKKGKKISKKIGNRNIRMLKMTKKILVKLHRDFSKAMKGFKITKQFKNL